MPDLTRGEAAVMILEAKFRAFTRNDWHSFAGCETRCPFIAESGRWIIVKDGLEYQFHWFDDNGGSETYSYAPAEAKFERL